MEPSGDGGNGGNGGGGGVDGCSALTFHLVWSVDSFQTEGSVGGNGADGISFHPDMVHQIFGPEEEIVGYVDPKVNIYLTPGSLVPFLKFSHRGVRPLGATAEEEEGEGNEDGGQDNGPTPVLDLLMHEKLEFERQEMEREVLSGCLTDPVEFRKALTNEAKNFHPPGDLIERFEVKNPSGEDGVSTYHIFKALASDPVTRKYHDKVQMLPLFFIDMASMLPLEKDQKWILYYLFESKIVDGDMRYGFVGFCSVYPFFAFPDKERRCISQFLILPTHRRRGLGERLLRRIYMDCMTQHDVFDIVVETPVMDFTRLRDRVELAILRENGVFQRLPDSKQSPAKGEEEAGTDISIARWDDGVLEEVRSKFKLYKFQVRRLYEVSKFYLLVKEKRDRSAFMEEVRSRLENQCRREFEGSAPDTAELEQVTEEKLMQTIMYYQSIFN